MDDPSASSFVLFMESSASTDPNDAKIRGLQARMTAYPPNAAAVVTTVGFGSEEQQQQQQTNSNNNPVKNNSNATNAKITNTMFVRSLIPSEGIVEIQSAKASENVEEIDTDEAPKEPDGQERKRKTMFGEEGDAQIDNAKSSSSNLLENTGKPDKTPDKTHDKTADQTKKKVKRKKTLNSGECDIDNPTLENYFSRQPQFVREAELKAEIDKLRAALAEKQRELEQSQAQCEGLQATASSLQQSKEKTDATISALKMEIQKLKKNAQERNETQENQLVELLRQFGEMQREMSLQKHNTTCMSLGKISTQRRGVGVVDIWEDGPAITQLNQKLEKIQAQREIIKKSRQQGMKKRGSSSDCEMPPPPSPMQLDQHKELCDYKLAQMKKEETQLMELKERLEKEKIQHQREAKRLRDEQRSAFNNFPLLNQRYLLLSLLGKGGFSEVFKGFDIVEMRIVACKVHRLHEQWSEEKKANYMRHATREYNIHRKLTHPNIVPLFDVFDISADCFCTVLQYCNGSDLDEMLKINKTLPEKEARCITMQIISALTYLDQQQPKIIHYDLKPANILFHNGEVKLTDFGLSKIMEDKEDSGMELTSQGAGTYWYLPPECFEIGHSPPKISSKVDVWSVGVILYQMLFGVKPFGDGMSQEKMLIEKTITKTTALLEIPSTPKISQEAKDFLEQCLCYDQQKRLEVSALIKHPHFAQQQRKS